MLHVFELSKINEFQTKYRKVANSGRPQIVAALE